MKGIIRALSKALNVAESDLSSGLIDGEKEKDGAEAFLEGKLTELHNKRETERKDQIEQHKKKAIKDTAEKFEKSIREGIPGIDPTLIGDELIKAIPTAVSKIRTAEDEPTKIMASQTYINGLKELETKLTKDAETKIKEATDNLTKLQQERDLEKVNTRVLEKARAFRSNITLRTDIDKEVVDALDKSAEAALLSNKFKILENGELVIVDENGALKQNTNGHALKVEDIITGAYAPVSKLAIAGPPRGDGGDPKGAGAAGKGLEAAGLTRPKTTDDYTNVLSEITKRVSEKKLTNEQAKALSDEAQQAVLDAIEPEKK